MGSFKGESYLIGYVSQLSWNWWAHKKAIFSIVLSYMWNWNFSEVVISASEVGSVNMYAKEWI